MSKLIRSPRGRLALFTLLFCGIGISILIVREVRAAPYSNPFWTNNSSSPESAIEMVADLAMVREAVPSTAAGSRISVDARTGELFYDLELMRMPGVVEDNVFAIRWRSMLSGSTQVGNGMIPSWETTAKYVVINVGNPTGAGGHMVEIRRPTGRIDEFVWDGSEYDSPSDVFDDLTAGGGGTYTLADRWGGYILFNSDGMPTNIVDRNGNADILTWISYQMTGFQDDRGKSYTISTNGAGRISSISNPAGQTWTLGYDSNGNLTTVTTPATPDQGSGVTVTLAYDGSDRLTDVTDGRGNAAWEFAYVGATGAVDTVTIDGDDVDYAYTGGRTDRTDRNGNVHRYHFSGTQVSKRDMYIASQAEFETFFYYSGVFPSYVVFPRGNRIDFTFDGTGNMTARRHRTTNTATNDASDILHQWGYTSNFVTSYTDPEGSQWTYGRDGSGNLTSVTHPTVTDPATQTASESWTFNGLGQVDTYTNEEGTETDYSYYASGTNIHLLQQIEVDSAALSLTRSFSYDSAGNVTGETDPNGKTWGRTWDALRRLTQAQAPSPLSYRVQHHYDGNGNLTSTDVENFDKDGNVVSGNQWLTTTRTYTATDDLATLVEEIDSSTTRTTSFGYDDNQNLILITKPEGNDVGMTYDERDLVASRTSGVGASGESTEEFTYDDNGNLAVREDGRDNDWTRTHDLFDRLVRETDPLGHYTLYTLDKNGRRTEVARKNSSDTVLQRETFYFDERGRHWKTSAAFKDPGSTYSDAVTVIARLKTGQVRTVTNPRGYDTVRDYDTAQRLVGITDDMGNEFAYVLDANGNQIEWAITEVDGGSTVTHEYEATYDEMNRRETTEEIDRTNGSNVLVTQDFHDSRSNLVFRIDAKGNPTRWTMDGVGRMIKVERALTLGATINDFTTAQVTQWGFDRNDRLVSFKDDGPNESTWVHDELDRPTTMEYPDSSTVLYEYDLNGNVVETTDPSGNEIDDTFDAANRNTSRSVTLTGSFLGTTSETRTFDGAGRMLTNEDNDYKVTFTWATVGLRSFPYTETQQYVGMTPHPKVVTKTYDAAGNRATETYPTGSGLALAYSYNEINGMTAISDGTNTIASFDYIGFRRKKATFQSGATATNLYTGFREEVESVRHETSGSSTILRLDYGYNETHDRTYERYGSSGSAGDAFEYDKLRRLTVAWMGSSTPSSPSGNTYVKKIEYNYDDDGNRTSVVTTPYGQSAQTSNYTTNNLNEYTAVGGTGHAWDANGNLTDNGTYLFLYDYKNHIVQVKLKSSGAVIASYRYDALGRRVEKNVGGTVERHILSIRNEPGEVEDLSHVVAVYDASDAWKQSFTWSDEVDGIQMLEQKDVLDYDTDGNTSEVTRSFYHRNALGSVMEITDLNEAAVVSYRYDPYGKVTITRGGTPQSSDPLGNHWTFTGRFLDEEAGLLYYRARYYDPATGRFLQRDPLGYAAGPSLFEYVRSRPSMLRDPAGLDTWSVNELGWTDEQVADAALDSVYKNGDGTKAWVLTAVVIVPGDRDLTSLTFTPFDDETCGRDEDGDDDGDDDGEPEGPTATEEADDPIPEEPDPTEGGEWNIIDEMWGYMNGVWSIAYLRRHDETGQHSWWTEDSNWGSLPDEADPYAPKNMPFDSEE